MPMREPESDAERLRVLVAKAALCEAGFADQAPFVQVNGTGHLTSRWFQEIYPTPARVWMNLMAWSLAYQAAPCGCDFCAKRNGNIWKDTEEMLLTFRDGLPQWRRAHWKAQRA